MHRYGTQREKANGACQGRNNEDEPAPGPVGQPSPYGAAYGTGDHIDRGYCTGFAVGAARPGHPQHNGETGHGQRQTSHQRGGHQPSDTGRSQDSRVNG